MLCPLCQSDNPAQAQRCRACGAPLKARPDQNGAAPDALPNGTLLIGTYAVEDVLGQGGFGITYRCHDQMLDRRVAVKEFFPSGCRRQQNEVAPSRGLSDASFREARAQFLAEARTLARCHHVGIVGVHAAFEANQTAYMVMELLHGKTLAQLLSARGGTMNQAESVGIIERVGEALQFVHEQNLLHRDIKPDNIIVCDDGRVMLIDFGTARETIQGQVQGQTVVVTPGYAPLEQYAKQAKRGAFTDIYSLAATLYHLLTGQMPPAASDRAMGVMLRPVREFNPQIGASVARATESALQMEIAKRPQSVREFLDLLGAPIVNSTPEISTALQSVIRRRDLLHSEDAEIEALFSPNRTPKGTQPPSVALFSDALQEGQTLLGNLLPDADDQASKPPLNPSSVALFSDTLQEHQTLLGNLLPVATAQPVKLAPPQDFVTSAAPCAPAQMSVASGNVRVQNSDPDNSGNGAWWGLAFVIGFGGLLFLLNSGGQEKFATPPPYSYSNPANVPPSAGSNSTTYNTSQNDSTRQAAMHDWNALRVLPPASVQTLPSSPQTKPQKADASDAQTDAWGGVEFSPDGKRLAIIDNQAVLRVFSVPDRRVLRSLQLDKSYAFADAMFSPDNKTIAVAQMGKTSGSVKDEVLNRVSVWSVRSGKKLGTFATDLREESVWPQAVLNDGQLLLRTSSNGMNSDLFQWNPKTKQRSKTPLDIADTAAWGYGVAAPNGKEFVVGDKLGRLRWLDLKTGQRKAEQTTKMTWGDYQNRFGNSYSGSVNAPLGVRGIDYALNGSFLASRNDGEIRVFDAKAKSIGSLPIGARGSMLFSMSPDGQRVVARGSLPYGPVGNLLWNIKTGKRIRLGAPSETLLDFGFSQGGKELYGIFTQGEQFQFVTWKVNAPTVAAFTNIKESAFEPANIRLNPFIPMTQAGELVALPVNASIEIRRQNGALVRTLNVGPIRARMMRLSSGGRFLALRKYDGAIQIWDVNSGESVVQLGVGNFNDQGARSRFGSGKNPPDLAFSPDNTLFACERAAGKSSLVELWSLQNEPRRLAAFAQEEPVNAVAFSPDSKSLICGGDKGLVQWIDVATKQPQVRIRASEPVLDVAGTAQNLAVVGASNATLYRLSPTSKNQWRQIAKTKIPARAGATGNPFSQWAVSADGELLATAARIIPVRIWHLPTGSLLQTLSDEQYGGREFSSSECKGLEFSADGAQLTILGRLANSQVTVTTWRQTK